jgi:serine/threonine protein kinase
MGNCNFKSEPEKDNVTVVTKNHFMFQYVIGRGGFGKVWKVQKKKSDQMFAMKEMLKSRVLAKRSVASVMNERKLLATIKHDFIVNIYYAFQDRENLYVILDLFEGGDLRYHLSNQRMLTETQTKFILA